MLRALSAERTTVLLDGRARKLDDDINTDYIIASTRKRETVDAKVLKEYLLETLDPAFAASVREGDLLVAGRNFGCGSAMEIAATVILAAGIKAVVAQSFSRTFYRNAVNNGLMPIECDTASIADGDRPSIGLRGEAVEVTVSSNGEVLVAAPIPPLMREIMHSGGMVEFMRKRQR